FGGEDEQVFRDFIDSSFTEIKEKDICTLIIDLRNHPGGDNSYSDYLTAYIADRPFRWYDTFRIRTSRIVKEQTNDTTTHYSRSIHDHADGERFIYDPGPVQPAAKEKRFSGEVYVLVNRQSHSMATVAAATIRDYGFGTIVGEETGEYATLYASQFSYELPATGIVARASKGYMVRPNGSQKQEGLIPDIIIRDHLLDDKDEIMEGLLKRLKPSQK
ncbi:MAG: S41 family peptidase, partial [Cyclobacteriaceae bacterium]